MSREGAEYALRSRADERDRISGDLLDLESHTTYQLLKGANLRDATRRRWEAAQADLAAVWSLYDAYRAVLRDAEQIGARRGRLGEDERAELTALLAGRSVVLKAAAKPVEQRSLLPAADERLTMDETVARMDASFREVTALLTDIDAAWNACLPRLDDADAQVRAVHDLEAELGESLDLTRLEDDLRRLRAGALEDPLGAAPPAAELDRVAALAAAARQDLERAVQVKREYGRRREDLLAALDRVRAAESEARLAHGQVVVKIALPPQANPRSRAEPLAGELAALDVSADPWLSRAARLTGLETGVGQALQQAQATTKALYGLIARRDELRGRLGATQAMAVRRGRAEDTGAAQAYERARLLLWTAPCDLKRAADAVEEYQAAIHGGLR